MKIVSNQLCSHLLIVIKCNDTCMVSFQCAESLGLGSFVAGGELEVSNLCVKKCNMLQLLELAILELPILIYKPFCHFCDIIVISKAMCLEFPFQINLFHYRCCII